MAQQHLETLEQTIERLTPTAKLALIERLARSLRDASISTTPAQQRDALHRLRQELATLPIHNPADGWSNRQHDQLLYGDL